MQEMTGWGFGKPHGQSWFGRAVLPGRAGGRASFHPVIAAALLLLSSLWPAEAAEPVRADPWQIIHFAREFGEAEVHRDGMNDPRITGEIDGQEYRIDFYGCRLGRDCQSILFSTRIAFEDEGAFGQEFAQEWNRRKLFGRAWATPARRGKAEMVLDHPVMLGEGVPETVFTAGFEQWRVALDEFTGEFARESAKRASAG